MSKTAHGPAVLDAVARCRPEDFQVDEQLGFEPDGDGDHDLVHVRKTGCNTHWVASQLATVASVSLRDVSYAGRKDRHAVTQQWFSVRRPGKSSFRWPDELATGIEILEAHRHRRKLRRGALTGNQFKITLRKVTGVREQIDQRLNVLAAKGIPNYFGAQRFGHDRRNLGKAMALFSGQRFNRNTREMLISAVRAELFNRVLEARVERGDWNRLLPGDIAGLSGSNSTFAVIEPDDSLEQRLDDGDIHPTGPLWGRGSPETRAAARNLEAGICGDLSGDSRISALSRGLEEFGARPARRKLRVMVESLSWSGQFGHAGPSVSANDAGDRDQLMLAFFLPAGSYATALLNELGAVPDAIYKPATERDNNDDRSV